MTKKDAEKITDYLNENGVKSKYMHSDIETLERIELIKELRIGKYQVLVGINLLREGLDIPECGLVAILDADKEGYLRSQVSLIQTIDEPLGKNISGRAILYADHKTESICRALEETSRRRINKFNIIRFILHLNQPLEKIEESIENESKKKKGLAIRLKPNQLMILKKC